MNASQGSHARVFLHGMQLPSHFSHEQIAAALLPVEVFHKYTSIQDPQRRQLSFAGALFLRCLLSQILQRSPWALGISHGPWGRPEVKEPHNFSFNFSKSGRTLLFGYSQQQLGVDVEEHHPFQHSPSEKLALLGTHPSSEEWCFLQTASDPWAAFFDMWTLKESLLKCDGRGFALPPAHVALIRMPQGYWRAKIKGHCSDFALANVALLPGCSVALCVRGEIGEIQWKIWTWAEFLNTLSMNSERFESASTTSGALPRCPM